MTQQKYRKIKKWFFTFPDSKDRSEHWIFKLWKSDIYFYEAACGVKEAHDDTGKAHLHFAVHLKHGISKLQLLDKVKALEPEDWKRIHFVPMRNTVDEQHSKYLSKEGVPWIRIFKEDYKQYLERTDRNFYLTAVRNGLFTTDEEFTSQHALLTSTGPNMAGLAPVTWHDFDGESEDRFNKVHKFKNLRLD